MLTEDIPEDKRKLTVRPAQTEIVLREDAEGPFALVLPPFEDLLSMVALSTFNFSIKELVEGVTNESQHAFKGELSAQLRKISRFRDSPVFFNRLANLANAAGDYETEWEHLKSASALSEDNFFMLRRGDNLALRGLNSEAAEIFGNQKLVNDIHATLRLAFYSLERKDVQNAAVHASRAIEIDPLDFRARLFQGGLSLLQANYDEAIWNLKLALEERPTSVAALKNLAVAYRSKNRPDKALASIRRAVALDPLNVSAVMMLSDIAFDLDVNHIALNSLRILANCEQKIPMIWARLARALFHVGEHSECVAALIRQGSIESSADVWNNLGVAYMAQGKEKKARESFKYGLEVAHDKSGYDYFLTARNTALAIAEVEKPDSVLKFTKDILGTGMHDLLLKDRHLSDLLAIHINSMGQLGQYEAAITLSEKILSLENANEHLRVWSATNLLAHYAYEPSNSLRVDNLVQTFRNWKFNKDPKDAHLKERLFNNIAVAFAERGELEPAQQFLSYISMSIHKTAYPTATLGLIHFRKGHIDRGMTFYTEAVGIAQKHVDKQRIRQKSNVEIGRYWLGTEPARAARYLKKALDISNGEPSIKKQAIQLMAGLNFKTLK
jgi:tetratricopeptide (TPR) repeat protein